MKRWLVVLLVVLAVIVLVSPGIIGRIAEKNLEENLAWVATESGGIEFQTESFDRGWFTSEGRHRVVLSGAAFREMAENYRQRTGNDDLPSLVIDTRIVHGLMPVASLTRQSGSLMPGLASTVSTFQLDPGDGELIALPGTLYSNVHLGGANESRFLAKAGKFEYGDVQIEWQGADIEVQFDRTNGALLVNGLIEPATITDDADTVRIGAISLAADQVRSDYGFNVGSAGFGVASFVVESPDSPVAVGAIAFSGDANVADARLNFSSKISIDEIAIPGMGDMSFILDLALNRLDLGSMQVIVEAFREAQGSSDPETALAGLFPQIESDLQNIVSSGAEIRVDQLDVTLPQGKVTTKLLVEIPEGDSGAEFSWSSVLLAMTASADVRMPADLFESVKMMNPQASALVAMGILQRDGDDYGMKAEYAQGLLNVNGAPLPIPMPGM